MFEHLAYWPQAQTAPSGSGKCKSMKKPVRSLYYQCRYYFLQISVEEGVTHFILSGIILKSLFARI